MNIGIVVAQQDSKLNELRRFLLDDWAETIDLFLFPECYLNADQLTETSKVVTSVNKWLITSYTDKRKPEKYETGVVFNRKGEIVGEHSKTTPTGSEREEGFQPGKEITAIDTEFGKVGVCVCYEMHFPEIAREYRLQGVKLIFNPIGTGMYDEEQYKVWTSLGRVRAYENCAFTFGCSHYSDAIPIAYAYDMNGLELLAAREANRMYKVTIDLEKTKQGKEPGLLRLRNAKLYRNVCKI